MRKPTNQQIFDLINAIAPFETQEDFDNAGFLIGSPHAEVDNILVALDATPAVVQEALDKGAQLLVVHHPLMFHAVKTLRQDTYEGALLGQILRSELSVISAHTNLDQTYLSGGAVIGRKLGLNDLRKADPFIYLGELPQPISARMLGTQIGEVLGQRLRCYGKPDVVIRTLAIAGGAYDEGYLAAREAGAQAYLTGEVRHHNALAAAESGFVLFDGGHYHTEVGMMHELALYLQNTLNTLQYHVGVHASAAISGARGCTL